MEDLDLIKQKLNIVDLIQEYLPLKKAGINFKANCPFHQEKSPSFVVSPERGIWHCFGCDRGGDIFKFLMEKESLSFPDTLELLAQKAGVTLTRKKGQSKKTSDTLFELNLKAAQFYRYFLLEHPLGKNALKYLKSRGLTPETIDTFQLGYAPQNWEALTKFFIKRGFTIDQIVASGLSVPSKRGGYDRFRGRVMFPLFDVRSRILGFAGRILLKGEPKYINSPQTEVFDKSKFLFGIHLAKDQIRQLNEAVVVEGEIDMILSYQVGVKNVVASKGTALTESHIELVKKYTDTLLLCFDTDLAGDSASRRGIEIADKLGMNLKVIRIKEGGKDPGELCLHSPEKWVEAVKNAVPIYDYYLESAQNRFNPKLASGKKSIFNELVPIWKKITDPMTKEHYTQKLAALLQIKDDVLREQIESFRQPVISREEVIKSGNLSSQTPVQLKKDDTIESKDRRRLLEEYLITLLLHLPVNHNFVPNFPETLFTSESLRQLYVLLVIYLDSISFKGKSFKIQEFVKMVPEEMVPRLDRLYLQEIDEKQGIAKTWQKEVDLVVQELKKMLIKASLEKLSLEIKNAQAFEKLDTLAILNKRFRDLSLKLKNL